MTVTAWASAFIGIRDAGEQISAGALSLGRLVIGAAALGAIVAIRREPLPARSDLPAIAFCGLLWFGIYNVALNEAERHVDAGTAAMLVNVGPILIALLAGVVLHEGFPRSLLAGSAVAFAGAILIGVATSDGGLAASGGAALCLVAALAYAGGVVSQKPVLARVSPLQVTFLACSVGALACLPFGPTLVDELGGARRILGRYDLPGPRADGARLHDLGVRAVAHHGGSVIAPWAPRPISCRRSRSSWPG